MVVKLSASRVRNVCHVNAIGLVFRFPRIPSCIEIESEYFLKVTYQIYALAQVGFEAFFIFRKIFIRCLLDGVNLRKQITEFFASLVDYGQIRSCLIV